jgi:hypothetical protein
MFAFFPFKGKMVLEGFRSLEPAWTHYKNFSRRHQRTLKWKCHRLVHGEVKHDISLVVKMMRPNVSSIAVFA